MKHLLASSLKTATRLAVLGLAAFFTAQTASALPPEIRWEKIETPHFTIIYDSKQQELGDLYARSAEQAFVSVSPAFGLWPAKTVIIVDDSTDIANGSATGVPYPLISSYPVLPTSLDSVADYGNWGLELITHEYTHILNFEPANGVMKPLRSIFGSIVRPNILLPRWYSEGLAVEMETRRSTFGRLRSANYLSIMRAMVDDKSLRREDISRINEVTIPDWPGGARPYLMGALLMDEIVRQKGDSIIGELNTAYSRRIPFFIDGPVVDRFGIGWAGLLAQTYERAEKMTERQLRAIRASSVPVETELEQSGYFSHSPTVSPDGKHLAFIGKEHNVDSLIFVTDRGADGKFAFSEKLKAASSGAIINRLSWTPDSKQLVHDGVETFQRYREYTELWAFDVESKKDTQLTHGLRAREPVVSPDGQWIVFEQITPGSTRLAATKIDGSSLSVLYIPPIQTRISRPEFLSANEIIFSEKRDDGDEVFKVARLKVAAPAAAASASAPAAGQANQPLALDGEPRAVLTELKPVHYPRMTRDGLLFVSDKSGVANLFVASKDFKRTRAITNTSTRVMTGEIDSQTGDLYYSKLMSYGPQLFRAPRENWTKLAAVPPQVGPFVDQQWPEFSAPKVEVDIKHEEYSPWWYLIPRYWMPYAYVAPGISYFSASTAASDPTGRHSYSLQASYDTLTNQVGTFGTYSIVTSPAKLTFSGQNSYDSISNGGLVRQTTYAHATATSFVPGLSNNFAAGLGFGYSNMTVGTLSLPRYGPEAIFSYSNIKQRGLEISPEKGGTASIGYQRFLPGPNDYEFDMTLLHGSKFFSGGFLPERHVAALFFNAALIPRLGNNLFGVGSVGSQYQSTDPAVSSSYQGILMRGYNTGIFFGRNLWQGTFEYRFPLLYSYRGYRTTPFFLQRWHGDVFVDALTLDGFAYDYVSARNNPVHVGSFFYGTGAEAKLDATIFYHVPIQFIFGLYYGTDSHANPAGLFPSISLGL